MSVTSGLLNCFYKNFINFIPEDKFEDAIKFKIYSLVGIGVNFFSKKLNLYIKNNKEIEGGFSKTFSYSFKDNKKFLDILSIKKPLSF